MTSILARNTHLIRASASRLICNARLTSIRQAPSGSHLWPTLLSQSPFQSPSGGAPTKSRGVVTSAMAPKAEHVTFEPESLPTVRLVPDRANAPADLDLLLIAVTQEDVTKEGEFVNMHFMLGGWVGNIFDEHRLKERGSKSLNCMIIWRAGYLLERLVCCNKGAHQLHLCDVPFENAPYAGEEAVLSSDRLKALDGECAGALSDCLATGGFEGKKVSMWRSGYACTTPEHSYNSEITMMENSALQPCKTEASKTMQLIVDCLSLAFSTQQGVDRGMHSFIKQSE
eukprot:1141463-Pelagomonas_calceolata.AAC.3